MDGSTVVDEPSALSSVLSTFLKKKNHENLIELLQKIKTKSDFVFVSRYFLTQEILTLTSCGITQLPTTFKVFSSIKFLDLSNNQLQSVDAVFSCSELETLLLRNNQLSSFPHQVKLLRELRLIDLSENNVVEVSIELLELPVLTELLLGDNLFQRFQSRTSNKVDIGDFKDFQEVKDPYTGENVYFNKETCVALKYKPQKSIDEHSKIYNLQKIIRSQLQCLSMSGNNLREIPAVIEFMVELEDVNLSNNELTSIDEVLKLPRLKTLNLRKNCLCEIKNDFTSIRMERLDLSENKFKAFPLSLLKLSKSISFLNLEGNSIPSIPDDVGFMEKLQSLNLRSNPLDESLTTRDTPTVLWQLRESALTKKNGNVPDSNHLEDEINLNEAIDEALEAKELCLRNFTLFEKKGIEVDSSLEKIDLSYNLYLQSFTLPKELYRLQKLSLNSCNLSSIPFSFEGLTSLKQLELKNNMLKELPEEVGKLNELSILDVSFNMLEEVPELNSQNLSSIFLDTNRLSSLEPIRKCCGLKVLSVSHNKIGSINNTLRHLDQLRELNISHNDISGDLSIDFGIMKLGKMNLSHNNIVQLEEDFFTPSLCASLEVLNLEGNELVVLPKSLGSMKRLCHLNVDMNPLESPPLSLCCEGAGTIVKYLELRRTSIARLVQSMKKGGIKQAFHPNAPNMILEGKGFLTRADLEEIRCTTQDYANGLFFQKQQLSASEIVKNIVQLKEMRKKQFQEFVCQTIVDIVESAMMDPDGLEKWISDVEHTFNYLEGRVQCYSIPLFVIVEQDRTTEPCLSILAKRIRHALAINEHCEGGVDESKYLLAFQYISPQGPAAKVVGKQNKVLILRKVILSEEESEREKVETNMLEKYFETVLKKFDEWKHSRAGARSLQAETNHRLRLTKSQLKRKRKELVIARANASDRIKALQCVKSEEEIVAVKHEMDVQIEDLERNLNTLQEKVSMDRRSLIKVAEMDMLCKYCFDVYEEIYHNGRSSARAQCLRRPWDNDFTKDRDNMEFTNTPLSNDDLILSLDRRLQYMQFNWGNMDDMAKYVNAPFEKFKTKNRHLTY